MNPPCRGAHKLPLIAAADTSLTHWRGSSIMARGKLTLGQLKGLQAVTAVAAAMAVVVWMPSGAKAMDLTYTAYRTDVGRAGAVVEANDFVRIGEKLAINIRYINETAAAAPAGAVVFSLPEGFHLVGADQVRGLSVSVDGGHAFGALARLTVVRDGQARAASADDVTHLRLVIDHDLPPGSGGEITVLVALR